jgi:UPF0716 protein FxsA
VLGVLVLLFLLVPIAELYVIIQVAHGIGVLNTLGLLILSGIVGGWLAKREGLALLRRIQNQLQQGQLPAKEVVDGGLILFAGALMLAPGFLTDLLAIALLIPPTRAVVRAVLLRRFKHQLVVRATGAGVGPGSVVDADSWESGP